MSRLDKNGLLEAATRIFEAQPDPSGAADLVSAKGSVVVEDDPKQFKAAFKRLKKVDGYRWIVINREDLFLANSLSIGSKAGIMDAGGKVLKAADQPRKR
ncbi:MAG: hypothetical protein HKN24_02675 [Acidimicrobiales bacterium]|nr:hypothetical protein [Acidimicrobiia bacterium]NNE94909.1 hypothetical protein [Acidimicrobiales bacterium]